jgi:uncharacterized membrane protein
MLQEYFIDPILQGSGYNIINTSVYAIIFALAVIGVYKLLKKWNIIIDRRFWLGVFPYIILGSIWRTLQDAGILNNPLFVTPLIYIVVFAVAIITLIFSRGIAKLRPNFLSFPPVKRKQAQEPTHNYYKLWSIIGFALVLASATFLQIQNPAGFIIIGIFALWVIAVFVVRKFFQYSLDNTLLLLAHIFDATTTFVAIQFFGYYEQHVLAGSFISSIGAWSMYLLKIPVVILVLWVLDREAKGSENAFIKLVILILGLAPGLRNFFRLIMGV